MEILHDSRATLPAMSETQRSGFRQKIQETTEQLEIRVGQYLRNMYQELTERPGVQDVLIFQVVDAVFKRQKNTSASLACL